MKEILEYTGSIHRIRRWSKELFNYDFAIIHRASSMMKDIDGLSRHIDIFIHRYLTHARSIRLADIALRPFAYSFDSFISWSSPRRVTASDIAITAEVSSTLFLLFIIHHSPINFTSTSILRSYSVPKPISNTCHHIVPPEDIIWLSFESINTSFGSLLSLCSRGTVTD